MSDESRSPRPTEKASLPARLRDLAARLDAWLDARLGVVSGRAAPALVPVPVRVRGGRDRRR